MKISKRDIKLIIVLFGAVVFCALYFGVSANFDTETAVLESQISMQETELAQLETYYSNLGLYEEETLAARDYVAQQLSSYPGLVLEEDIIIWLLKLEETTGFAFNTLAFSVAEELLTFNAVVDVLGTEQSTEMVAYKTSTNTAGDVSYEQLKNTLDYIYDAPMRATLDNVTISYNAETAGLTANMSISHYFILHDYAVYVPSDMPDVALGNETLFGSAEEIE